MEVESLVGDPVIQWEAYAPDGLWFEATFELPDMNILQTTSMPQSIYLKDILLYIQELNDQAFQLIINFSSRKAGKTSS